MKTHKITRFMAFVGVLTISFTLLSGCGSKNNQNSSSSITETVTPSSKVETTTTPDDSNTDAVATDNANKDTNTNEKDKVATDSASVPATTKQKELPIYTINNDSLEKEDYTDMVPEDSDINAEFIVKEVVKVLEENGLKIGINSVTTKGDTIIVDFQSDKAPLVNVGSGVEVTILDCIAQSLVDNLEGHNKVIYHVDGKAYESGHIILDLNEVYLND